MNACPCCSNQLLRHIRSRRIYWYCSHCKQEMPNWEQSLETLIAPKVLAKTF